MVAPKFSNPGREYLNVVRGSSPARRKRYELSYQSIKRIEHRLQHLSGSIHTMLNEKPLVGVHWVSEFPFSTVSVLGRLDGSQSFRECMILSDHVMFLVAHGYCGVHSQLKKGHRGDAMCGQATPPSNDCVVSLVSRGVTEAFEFKHGFLLQARFKYSSYII